jgi:hypothetical protein
MTQQQMKVSHCHFFIIDGILQVQLKEVIKQFYSSIIFLIKTNFETPLGSGRDQTGFRPG